MVDVNTEAKDFDTVADELLDKAETETPSESSTEIRPEDHSNDTDVTTGTEPAKTEQVKKVEEDGSLSVDEKMAKIKEILGEDQDAIDAYVKAKGYHTDPAWVKQRELIDKLKKESEAKEALSEKDKAELAKIRSSREYIQTSMKEEGYTQEAIDKKLKEAGFNVETKTEDDLQFILDKTGTKKESLAANQLDQIEDIIKITKLLIQKEMSNILPKELAPVKDHLSELAKEKGASVVMNTIKDTVKTEGILDYAKDIEPALNKFLDENPDATQQDVLEHFKSINHSLSVERLKTGKRKDERDEKKLNQRQNISTVRTPSGVLEKTKDFDKDADAFLDAVGVT